MPFTVIQGKLARLIVNKASSELAAVEMTLNAFLMVHSNINTCSNIMRSIYLDSRLHQHPLIRSSSIKKMFFKKASH